MRAALAILTITAILLGASQLMAQNKVVVIPLVEQKPTTCIGPTEVLSAEGRCWMDRNLGASRVATSAIDGLAFGDYFQWGRLSDGHQYPNSATIALYSPKDVPRHSDFITVPLVNERDWRNPQNDNLWKGLYGINNPCPQGFRLPTEAEWDTETASWGSQDAAGAFASPLKLVLAGIRYHIDGSILKKTVSGNYWSSTVGTFQSKQLGFSGTIAPTTVNTYRAFGLSVRCIKD